MEDAEYTEERAEEANGGFSYSVPGRGVRNPSLRRELSCTRGTCTARQDVESVRSQPASVLLAHRLAGSAAEYDAEGRGTKAARADAGGRYRGSRWRRQLTCNASIRRDQSGGGAIRRELGADETS